MIEKILVLFVLLFAFGLVRGQEVQVNEAPGIGGLVSTWVKSNRTNAHIEGWRVQILSTTDRQQADLAKIKAQGEFPGLYADWVHEKPYYKMRLGACRSKLDAMALLATLRDYYPGAYVTQDKNIHPRDFLSRQ